MDKQLQEKLDILLARMEKEDKRASASFTVSLICRVLITLFIVGYLGYTVIAFEKMSTPSNMAIMINRQVRDLIPSERSEMQAKMPEQAKEMAKSTVGIISDLIPSLGEMAREQLDVRFAQLMDHYKVEREKAFEHICSNIIDKIRKNKDIVKDSSLAQALAQQLADECNREARDIINNALFKEIEKLQADVEKLRSTPVKMMTRSQAAKKNLIVCWIYLVDNKGLDQEGLIGNAASFIGQTTEDFISSKN
jgi:hypothetical protein